MTETDIASRLRKLEDKDAIRDRWMDYFFALDSLDWPALGDVFTQDATLEVMGLDRRDPARVLAFRGRDRIVGDFYRGAEKHEGKYINTGHHGTNLKIDLAGDSATTLAYFIEVVRNSRLYSGTYQHRFVRQGDGWRMAFLRIAVRYQATLQATDLVSIPLSTVRRMPIPG